ncbi:hypothetical protein COOONC_09969 [Cooperia oncophora]
MCEKKGKGFRLSGGGSKIGSKKTQKSSTLQVSKTQKSVTQTKTQTTSESDVRAPLPETGKEVKKKKTDDGKEKKGLYNLLERN